MVGTMTFQTLWFGLGNKYRVIWVKKATVGRTAIESPSSECRPRGPWASGLPSRGHCPRSCRRLWVRLNQGWLGEMHHLGIALKPFRIVRARARMWGKTEEHIKMINLVHMIEKSSWSKKNIPLWGKIEHGRWCSRKPTTCWCSGAWWMEFPTRGSVPRAPVSRYG